MKELTIPLVQDAGETSQNAKESTSLDSTTRFRWFATCASLGAILSFVSFFWISVSIVTFAALYTFGSISMVASTFFLSGPSKQFQSITSEHRLTPALLYFAAILATLFFAFYPGIWLRSLWTICAVLLQFISMLWYNISYFPKAKEQLKRIGRFLCEK